MAITPRTILTSAAPATVAVVSLYFFTVLGTAAFTCLNNSDEEMRTISVDNSFADTTAHHSTACDNVAAEFGDDRAGWSEVAWINYALCFVQQDDSPMVVQTAGQGLKYYPTSEMLYNLKGFHLIALNEHAEAIEVLREGMDSVAFHRNGIMANNLARAGLWEPRMMRLEEARQLYIDAQARSPRVCEILHTGLFVEFAMADQGYGKVQLEALRRFSDLRKFYNRCLDRLDDGQWSTVVEIVGAAVLFDDIDGISSDSVHPLMRSAVATIQRSHKDTTVDELCSEAMPLAGYHHQCVDTVNNAIKLNAELESRHAERNQRAAQVRGQMIIDHRGETRSVTITRTLSNDGFDCGSAAAGTLPR